jgi:hypothetical protein
MSLPSSIQLFLPSPPGKGHKRPSPAYKSTQKKIARQLEDEMLATDTPAVTQLPVAKVEKFLPLTATVRTEEGRAAASEPFLNACRLLAHHSTKRVLHVEGEPVDPNTIIYVREPCGLFRREILRHLDKMAHSSSFMPTFHSYMEATLSPVQVQMSGIYDPHFFSGTFLQSFLSVESWMVSDHILPRHVPSATFHVYKLITCLQKYAGHALILPANGLTMLEATQVGLLTYYLFAMMDLTEDTFSDRNFAGSILGLRLKAWSTLPTNTTIHSLWNQAPLQTTYHWFASLQQLLSTEQNWVKRLRFHPDQGFYQARDAKKTKFLLMDSQIRSHIPGRTDSLMEAMRQFDHLFESRWFRTSVMDPIWSTPIPPGHSLAQPATVKQPISDQREYERQDNQRQKRAKLTGSQRRSFDFVSSTPPMEIIQLIPGKTVTHTLMRRFTTQVRFPRLPAPNGTLQTLCLNSAFQNPHNGCDSSMCGDRSTNPRTPRLHIDMSREPWRSQPEMFWLPLVEFLQSDPVRNHIRPSAALRQATPGAQWH